MKHSLIALCLLVPAIAANAQSANQAVLTWTAPANYVNADGTVGAPIVGTPSYNVYQGAQGATKSKVGSASAVTYTATGLTQGTTVCWQVSAVLAGQESALSNEACKTFPLLAPGAPTSLKVQ
jgi:hypothetical protein